LPAARTQVWAVAPALNLSGQPGVDPLLQADRLFAELEAVRGIRAVPVNRVVQAYAALGLDGISSAADARAVCAQLGVDALVVPTVTLYDPYAPPTMAASIQIYPAAEGGLFSAAVPGAQETLRLTRSARSSGGTWMPGPEQAGRLFVQEAGVFDASHGTTRAAVLHYASGRTDPNGPAGSRAGGDVLLVMDRYVGFVYHALLSGVMEQIAMARAELSGGEVR
jgi:hypothetical protein